MRHQHQTRTPLVRPSRRGPVIVVALGHALQMERERRMPVDNDDEIGVPGKYSVGSGRRRCRSSAGCRPTGEVAPVPLRRHRANMVQHGRRATRCRHLAQEAPRRAARSAGSVVADTLAARAGWSSRLRRLRRRRQEPRSHRRAAACGEIPGDTGVDGSSAPSVRRAAAGGSRADRAAGGLEREIAAPSLPLTATA